MTKIKGGKGVEFSKVGQIFTQITEHTATVTHILGVVTETWGPGYVLVTVDGLTIEDSDGTRGILLISIRLYDQVLISVMYLLVIYVTS